MVRSVRPPRSLLAGLVLLPLGLWLGDSGVERALLAASVILVFIVRGYRKVSEGSGAWA